MYHHEIYLLYGTKIQNRPSRQRSPDLSYQNNTLVCPVSTILRYLFTRLPLLSQGDSPLFIHKDGSPLTKVQFVSRVRQALSAVGIHSSKYARHSFKIGAATSAIQAGCPDHLIKALGQWDPSAYQSY